MVAPDGIRGLPHRLGELEGLDPLVRVFAAAARPLAEGPVRPVLAGQWLGHSLHPLLTDLPIGCWTSSWFLDIVGGKQARPASQRLIGLGILTALPAAASGASDWSHVDRPSQRVGVVHAVANVVGLACYVGSYRARRRGRHAKGVLWGMAGAAAASVAGHLGGHLALDAAVTRDNRLLPADPLPTDAPAHDHRLSNAGNGARSTQPVVHGI